MSGHFPFRRTENLFRLVLSPNLANILLVPTGLRYINFAHGDETQEEIYGESLPRLRHLKKHYDPQNRFNQYFPITPLDH